MIRSSRPQALDPADSADTAVQDPRQRRSILVAVCIALMAVIASVSGLSVAQPELSASFGASQTEVLWIINVYTITLAALLLPLGALGDRLGRKPMLLAGLLVFGVASAAAGLAGSPEVMLGARFLSGVGAAMIMPVTLAVITSTFPEEERAKAIGVWTGVAGGGGILGMFLSAALVDLASWRWLFVLPVVLVVVAGALALRSIPNSRQAAEHRFDTVGALTSLVAVVGLVYFLHEGPDSGWTAPATLVSGLIGVLGGAGFVLWELRSAAPLLDVRLFRERRLAGGSMSLLAVFGVQAGIFVVLFPFLQAVLGWSSLHSTLAMMPMALLMMAASGLAPRLAPRIGSRATMATGILVSAAGLALMAALVSVTGGYLSILPGMLAMGLGMGLTMTPATEAITSSLPHDKQGVGSALNDVTREFGTALGVALLGAIVTAGYRSTISPKLHAIPPHIAETARQGIANALTTAPTAGTQAQALKLAARDSFVSGWQNAMWAGAAVMAIVFVVIAMPGIRRRSQAVETQSESSVAPQQASGLEDLTAKR
nr:MFS transporter [Catenulispora acidiphila]